MHPSIRLPVERRRIARYLIGTLLLCLGACASTQVVDRWRDPSFRGPPLHRMLVVDLQQDLDRRRLWEDSMAASLLRLGVAATPSYRALSEEAPNPEQLTVSATREGFDVVMATHFITTQSQYWMPGNPGLGFGSRWRYFDYWDATRGPGFVQAQPELNYQSELFTMGPNGGKLIWSGTTRGLESGSIQSATEHISRALVPALQQAGILSR